MHKVLTAAQIRDLDHYTIKNEPISSINLMERASRSFAEWFAERFHSLKKTGIVCGTGNNGGDGLAVARMLAEWGYPVKVWVIRGGVPESPDFHTNLERLANAKIQPAEIASLEGNPFSDCEIIVDAIFGSGLSRPVEGIYAEVIRLINQTPATVVSVDMPSGLRPDETSTGEIIKADYTIAFQFPKLSFFLPQSFQFTGEWAVVDIGLHKEAIRNAPTSWYFLSPKGVRRLYRPRGKFDHKGTYGHALIIAGSLGKIGAAILASNAAVRAGAGLLTVYSPECGYEPLQTALPEAMVVTDPNHGFVTAVPDTSSYRVVGIGPGMGQATESLRMFRSFLEKNDKPLVLDADALNMLSANRELMHLVPPDSILTPHPKEFERLAGAWSDDFDRLAKQKEMAAKLKSVIIVKGSFSSIATPAGVVYFNTTGNPGMATGGTGDVLTGIVTGLRAQNYDAISAAILGVYLHGLSGDLAAREIGTDSLIASDLIKFLPAAFRKLTS